MLTPLHGVVWGDFGSAISRSLMLAHLGLFLLWQPIWRSDERLDPRGAAAFIVFTVAFVAWLNWWFVFVWLLLLVGLIGGRVFVDRREQLAYGITLLILISELIIGVMSRMFLVPLPREVEGLFEPGLLIAPVLLLLIPVRRQPTERSVDLLHGLTAATLTSVLALGSLLVMYRTGDPYPVAVLYTLAAITLFLLGMAWLLTPHPGFSGLAQLWARYLLNVGTPFEQWLGGLSQAARQHQSPGAFLEAAMAQVAHLPWVAAVAWRSPHGGGQVGGETPYATSLTVDDVTVRLYTRRAPGTALLLHAKLLIQVIGHFHAAKVAQQTLARQAHLQAVYETGARVTHDIKNLLQSLYTMGTVVQDTDPARAPEVQGLLRRQLPQLTNRLELALDKLRSPADSDSSAEMGSLHDWWEEIRTRHATNGVVFEGTLGEDREVEVDFLDSVAENLIENARSKRHTEPGIEIRVRLSAEAGALRLTVCDTGSAVPPAVAASLFVQPVESRSGLGIGLYQAARQAEGLGYTLTLAANEPGRVCFEVAASGTHRCTTTVA